VKIRRVTGDVQSGDLPFTLCRLTEAGHHSFHHDRNVINSLI
jgi:hypothetical protein